MKDKLKTYWKELAILVLQLLAFYLLPLFGLHKDPIGMVLMLVLITLVLSLLLGWFSRKKLRLLYPVVVAVLFLPSVYLYYNESALIHALWYLVVSTAGLLLGVLLARPKKKN